MAACGRVNFVSNFAKHENIINLFTCTGWRRAYPDLFGAIGNIKGSDWDHIYVPIGKEFFDNRERRDRVFKYIKELDSKKGLDDLARVVTSLNETNFYDSLHVLFLCANTPNSKECKERTPNLLSKEQIKNIFRFMMIDSDLYAHSSNILRNVVGAIGGDSEVIRTETLKFYKKTSFIKLRLSLVSRLLNTALKGITNEDRSFIAKVFFTITKEDGKPWLHRWFTNEKLTNDQFSKLFRYPVSTNPKFIKDSLALNNAFENRLMCKTDQGEGNIEIDVKHHLEKFLSRLSQSSFKEFMEYALQNTGTLVSAKPFCSVLDNFKSDISYYDGDRLVVSKEYTLKFIELVSSLGEFLGEETNFDLMRILTTASRGEGSASVLYVLSVLSGEPFQAFNELNKVILDESDDFYPLVLNIIKRVNEDIYSQMGAVALTLMDETNEEKFKALSSLWKFWSQTERNFLFRFVDRHLDEETNFMDLFLFYSKLLGEMPGVIDNISKQVVGSDEALEKTYASIESIVSNFSGKKVLKDFKKFFRRDQIIKAIEIISKGTLVDSPDVGGFNIDYVDDYVRLARQTPFDYSWAGAGLPNNHIVECITEMSNPEQNFYTLIRNLPEKCKKVKEHEITIRMFTWLDNIDKGYHRSFSRTRDENGLFDSLGIMSPAVLGTNVGLLKLVQEKFNGGREGVKYVLDTLNKYFFKIYLSVVGETGALKSVEGILGQVERFNKKAGAQGTLHRSFIVKEFAIKEEWKVKKRLAISFTTMLKDYHGWSQKNSGFLKNPIEEMSQPDEFKCENYQNMNIGNNPCPERKEVKIRVKKLLEYLARKNEDDAPTGVGQLIRSAIPTGGLRVPFDREGQTLKRMTIKETMKMMYQLTDKSLDVNRKMIPYIPEGVRPSKVEPEDYLQEMTTMERVEVTIRDVRFDMNYLGAHYHNSVARSIDYNKTVRAKSRLMKACIKLRFCGKFFSRDQYRMGFNSVHSYDGLLEANSDPRFGYGDYMKGLLSIVVGSSSKVSRKDTIVRKRVKGKEISIPYVQTKKQLEKHNGVILTELGMMSAFSNGGRILRDRVGRTQKEFDEFLNSRDLGLVDEKMLEGFSREEGEKAAVELLNTLLRVKSFEGTLFHEEVIDFLGDLNYSELRFVERTVSDLLVVFSHVGIPPWVPREKRGEPNYKRYIKSNYFNTFKYMDRIVNYFPLIKNSLPQRGDGSRVSVLDILKSLSVPLKFFRKKLETEDEKNLDYYFVLNELFLGLDKFLFQLDPDVESLKKNGMDFTLEFLNDREEFKDLALNIRHFYSILSAMHALGQVGSFSELGENLSSVVGDPRVNFEAFREYINHTGRENNCQKRDGQSEVCETNVHYDELAKFNSYVLKRDNGTNLERGLLTLLETDKQEIINLINDVTPYIHFSE